jgi:hypothetical protein
MAASNCGNPETEVGAGSHNSMAQKNSPEKNPGSFLKLLIFVSRSRGLAKSRRIGLQIELLLLQLIQMRLCNLSDLILRIIFGDLVIDNLSLLRLMFGDVDIGQGEL